MDVHVLRVRLRTLGSTEFPKFPGIALEGAVAAALRELACPYADREGTVDCGCVYHGLLRPGPSLYAGLPRRFSAPSAPVVLRPRVPRGTYPPGTEMEVEVVIVGRAWSDLPALLAAILHAGKGGMGAGRRTHPTRGRFEVLRVDVVGPREERTIWEGGEMVVPACLPWRYPDDFESPLPQRHGTFTLEFRSPTQLKKGDTGGLPAFVELVGSLGGRISRLSSLYGDRHLVDYEDHASLARRAGEVRVDGGFCEWEKWPRHSSRQDREFEVEGRRGWIRYRGDVAPFVALLRLAELMHVGRHTLCGCGEVSLLGERLLA